MLVTADNDVSVTGTSWDSTISIANGLFNKVTASGDVYDLSITAGGPRTLIDCGGVSPDPSGVGSIIGASGTGGRVDAGDGNDTITAEGRQTVFANGGNDEIWADNGVRNVVDGGAGTNTCHCDLGPVVVDQVTNATKIA